MSAPLPTGPKWLSSVIENQRHISRATINLATEALGDATAVEGGSSSTALPASEPFVVSSREYHTTYSDAEPLPHLNYSLLHTLISLCLADLSSSNLRLYHAVVSARTVYYDKTESFWHQYRGLADAWAATEILVKEIEVVEGRIGELKTVKSMDGEENMDVDGAEEDSTLSPLENKLQTLHATRTVYNRQLVHRMDALTRAGEKRDEACKHFSRVKVAFLEKEGGRLRFLAEHLVRGKAGGGV